MANLGTGELRFWQQLFVKTLKFKILQFYKPSSAENYLSHCHCNQFRNIFTVLCAFSECNWNVIS